MAEAIDLVQKSPSRRSRAKTSKEWHVQLFDDGLLRTDTEPAAYSEPHYAYLNRTGRSEAGLVRALLETWFSNYTSAAKGDLQRRFRSSDELVHYGAFFELYVHELLRRVGCSVEAIIPNPRASMRVRTPDFRVRGPGGDEYLVEATIASDKSREGSAAEKIVNRAYDCLNHVSSANFFIGLEVHGKITRTPKQRDLVQAVERFLAPLNPDVVAASLRDGGLRSLPRARIALEGGHFEIFPIPKSPAARGQPGVRPLGMLGPGEARWVDDSMALRKSVAAKATRYGVPEVPYVIAVDAISQMLDQSSIMEALLGKETYTLPVVQGRAGEPVMQRKPNGAWLGPNGPINRRVSAVLIASSVIPWSVAAYTPILYHNPFATIPLDPQAFPEIRRATAVDDRMLEREGRSAAELFSLPSGWPQTGDEAP